MKENFRIKISFLLHYITDILYVQGVLSIYKLRKWKRTFELKSRFFYTIGITYILYVQEVLSIHKLRKWNLWIKISFVLHYIPFGNYENETQY